MSMAHDLHLQKNTEPKIPTQRSLKGPILDLITNDEFQETQQALSSEESLKELRLSLDKKNFVNGTTIICDIYEQIGAIPAETPKGDEESEEDFKIRVHSVRLARARLLQPLTEADEFFQNNFYSPGLTTGRRINSDLIEKLYDDTELAHDSLIDSITNAQNSGILGTKYLSKLIEADRLARLLFIENQGSTRLDNTAAQSEA